MQWCLLLASLATAAAAADEIPAARQKVLANLLKQDCGSCHGLLFKGGLGPPLLPDNLNGKPDAALVDTILNGRPGTAMPPWRGLLSPAEATWLLQQLRNSTQS